jgi:hypothetical protein
VKAAVEAAVGAPAADQTLTFGTAPLTSDAATLASASVPNGGTLDLAMSSVPSTAFIIHVELPPALQPTHGLTLTLISSTSATVAGVKAQMASVTGLSSAEQALAFGSVALMSDPQTMGNAGVATGDTLTLSIPSPYVIVKMPASLVYTDIGSSDFTTSAWIDIGTRVGFLSGHSRTRSKLARTAALPLVETPTRRSA